MIEKYRVTRKRAVVEAITKALDSCGVAVVQHPDINEAPFRYTVKLPDGGLLELICYAFLANKYRQGGRPSDEHRFQIKYGGDFHRPHTIFIDPKREIVTLFFGVHLAAGVFVAVDPAMHNPTWFSSSVEFKTRELDKAKKKGWATWERQRSASRRRAGRETENFQTEALVAFTPDNFLRYIHFERLATGLDVGERVLLADKLGAGEVGIATEHPLEMQFGLSAREILDVIWGRFRLETAVRGGIAEHHLGTYLRSQPDFSDVQRLDKDGSPDFQLTYRRSVLLIECKNALRRPTKDGYARVDFQKTRAAKSDPCSRYYDPESFDILAACLHPVTERWEFSFALTSALEPHKRCPGKLASNVTVEGSRWSPKIQGLI